jgi:hypothetical protein
LKKTSREMRKHINSGAAHETEGGNIIKPISNELDIVAECLAEGMTEEEINKFMSQSDGYAKSMIAKIRGGLGTKAQ